MNRNWLSRSIYTPRGGQSPISIFRSFHTFLFTSGRRNMIRCEKWRRPLRCEVLRNIAHLFLYPRMTSFTCPGMPVHEDLLMTFWGPFEDLLRTFWGPCEDLLRTFWGPFEDLLRTFWGPFEDLLRTFWGYVYSQLYSHLTMYIVNCIPLNSKWIKYQEICYYIDDGWRFGWRFGWRMTFWVADDVLGGGWRFGWRMTFWMTLDGVLDDVLDDGLDDAGWRFGWRWMTFWMRGDGGGGVYKFRMTFWMTLDDVLDDVLDDGWR